MSLSGLYKTSILFNRKYILKNLSTYSQPNELGITEKVRKLNNYNWLFFLRY